LLNFVLLAILLASGGAFAITFNRGLAPGHALLNTEGITAVAFLVLVFMRSRPGEFGQRQGEGPNRYAAVALALFATILIAYWGIFGAPFLYDDFTHIADARNSTWWTVLSAFGPVEHKPGLFFRPFGFLVYWLNYLWAGTDPRKWHFASMILHGTSCSLLFALCRELRLSWPGSLGAAFLFALNASSAEAVAWIDARFDPMATCFVLASLLCVCRFLQSGRGAWILAASVAGTCAMLSKESAFFLTLLVVCLGFFRPREEYRRLSIACGCLVALAATLFAYRWWALGSVGGYRSAGGELDIVRFHPVQTVNAILVRDWTLLFFPLNWSSPPGRALTFFLVCTPIVFAACAWWARLPRRVFLGSVALTLAAALPVQHLLLIGTDLSGARIVYLLSIGWAVLWGGLFSAIARVQWRALAMAWMLVLHTLMLRHNLAAWIRVPEEANRVCAAFARSTSVTQEQVVVSGLPSKKSGVVFLANGFPECVAMNGLVPRKRIQVQDGPGANFAWNESSGRVEPLR
jgi:hypothetical protein